MWKHLIGPDIYDDPDLELTGEDIKRINPFDWNTEFKEIIEMAVLMQL